MAKKKTSTAEDKLRALFDLQIIDSRIDRLRVVRGELPLEVQDLEDELEGLRARLERMEDDNDQVNQRITAYQMQIKDSQALIEKYTEQQNNVRNNREFESLSKEIEYQTLEIELCEKRIRECKAQVEQKAEGLDGTRERYNQRQADLEAKKAELDAIIAETQAEEELLQKHSDKTAKGIEDRLVNSYRRIRGAAKNGLAVVPIERQASAGTFIKISPSVKLTLPSASASSWTSTAAASWSTRSSRMKS